MGDKVASHYVWVDEREREREREGPAEEKEAPNLSKDDLIFILSLQVPLVKKCLLFYAKAIFQN